MSSKPQPRRLGRRVGIDRFAGLPPQFERANPGWYFRRHGHGPAIRVSDEEHAAFMRTGLHALLLHAAALAAFGWLAWLLLKRMLPTWSDNAIAVIFGVAVSLIALALHLSMRHHADAPARALASRSPEKPARDPDDSMQPNYATIVVLVLFLLFMAAIGTGRPTSFYVAFASGSVMLGVILTLRRWVFGRALTVAQRERLRAKAAENRAQRRARTNNVSGQSFWQLLLLLVFVAIALAMLAGGVLLGVGVAQAISGQTSDNLSFGVFMLGFLPGLAFGGLCFWPLERLCKRWTGCSAVDAFDWIPASW